MKFNLKQFSSAAARGSWHMTYRLVKWLLIICLAIMLGFTMFAVSSLPSLQPWHTERLAGEFKAYKDSDIDFDTYMRREAVLFGNMQMGAGQRGLRLQPLQPRQQFRPSGRRGAVQPFFPLDGGQAERPCLDDSRTD